MKSVSVAVVVALCMLATACGEGDPGVLQPTVNPATITDTFSGNVAPNAADSHAFVIALSGKIAITLTSVGPPSTAEVSVGIGIPTGLACSLTLGDGTTATTTAGSTPQISGTVLPGTFCVVVFDLGKLTEAVDYTVTVAHP
jgi:hypothetical protein